MTPFLNETPRNESIGSYNEITPSQSPFAPPRAKQNPSHEDYIPPLDEPHASTPYEFHEPPLPGKVIGTVAEEEVREPPSKRLKKPSWKSWAYVYLFFAIALSIHVIQIVVLELLSRNFLRAENETYEGKNFIVFGSDNMSAYFAWQYLPAIIAVGVSVLWEELNVTIQRLEPFYQLSRGGGADTKNSLSMDYITAISLFTPFKAAYARHWVVALSSIVYVIAFAVLPTLFGQLLYIVWDDEGRGFIVLSPPIARATEGVLGVVIVLAITLLVMIRRRPSGLISDPASIGGPASLISHSRSVVEVFQTLRPYENQDDIDSSLKGARFSLEYIQEESDSGKRMQYQILARSPVSQGAPSPPPPFKQRRRDAHSIWLWGRTQLALIILMAAPNIVIYMAAKSEGNFPPRLVKAFFTLSSVESTALWQVWQREVSSLEPYYQLSKRKRPTPGTPHAVHYDFIASSSLGAFFKSLGRRCFTVAYISFCVLLVQTSMIFYPVLFNNRFAIIVANQEGNLTDKLFSPLMLKDFDILIWTTWPLVIVWAIGWILLLVTRRKPFLPRKPPTVSSTILYICNTSNLLQDFENTSTLSQRQRVRQVR